eukprot:3563680-Rhodomonas_salina.1
MDKSGDGKLQLDEFRVCVSRWCAVCAALTQLGLRCARDGVMSLESDVTEMQIFRMFKTIAGGTDEIELDEVRNLLLSPYTGYRKCAAPCWTYALFVETLLALGTHAQTHCVARAVHPEVRAGGHGRGDQDQHCDRKGAAPALPDPRRDD